MFVVSGHWTSLTEPQHEVGGSALPAKLFASESGPGALIRNVGEPIALVGRLGVISTTGAKRRVQKTAHAVCQQVQKPLRKPIGLAYQGS